MVKKISKKSLDKLYFGLDPTEVEAVHEHNYTMSLYVKDWPQKVEEAKALVQQYVEERQDDIYRLALAQCTNTEIMHYVSLHSGDQNAYLIDNKLFNAIIEIGRIDGRTVSKMKAFAQMKLGDLNDVHKWQRHNAKSGALTEP